MGNSVKNARSFDAIVLAAGKGTRMKSDLPKVLHKACGWTMLRLVGETVRKSACNHLIFVLGHGRGQVEAEVGAWKWTQPSPEIKFAFQAEQKGTGDAVRVGLTSIEEKSNRPILILSGDAPLVTDTVISQILQQHLDSKADLTVGAMRPKCAKGYGRIVGAGGQVYKIVEEKEASSEERDISLVNGGIYAVSPGILREFLSHLKPSNAAKEFYFTDIVEIAASHGKKVTYAELPAEELMGVNDLEQLSDAAHDLRRRRVRELLQSGVIIEDHRHCYIDMGVRVEPGAVLETQCFLYGDTQVGARARIESGVRLENSFIGAGARIKASSYLEDCRVADGAVVGPMAHLRPGTQVGKNAKIGNFVELKKAIIGDNTKVSHLSYVGDAKIGRDANIGCGFITCNYDGLQKHETLIGDRVFIGSDVQVVAPITIGADAYVASGSTVTKNVPDTGDLVIARVRQENKTGYAKRLMAMKKSELSKK